MCGSPAGRSLGPSPRRSKAGPSPGRRCSWSTATCCWARSPSAGRTGRCAAGPCWPVTSVAGGQGGGLQVWGGGGEGPDQPVVLRGGAGRERGPAPAVAVGDAVARVGERLLPTGPAVAERALAQHRVVLRVDVEADRERLVVPGDQVVADRVGLGDRGGGVR